MADYLSVMEKILTRSMAFFLVSLSGLSVCLAQDFDYNEVTPTKTDYISMEIDAWYRIQGVRRANIFNGDSFPGEPLDEVEQDGIYEFRYDEHNRLQNIRYHRTGPQKMDPFFGVAQVEISYERGYVLWEYMDSQSRPMANNRGVWADRIQVDDLRRRVGVFHYDRLGNLSPDIDGVALRLWELDERGRRSVERLFDASGTRIQNKNGVSEVRYKWSVNDDMSAMRFFGIEGTPVRDSMNNVHGYIWERNEFSEAFRENRIDIDEHLVEALDGSAAIEWSRDSRGRIVEERRLGIDGNPKMNVEGVALYRRAYDKAGNLRQQRHFDAEFRPVKDIFGVSTYKWIYYPQGREMEQINLDEENKLTLDDSGMASYRWQYNDRGQLINSISFGLDDLPRKDTWGVARYQYAYDDTDNLVEACSYRDWELLAEDQSGVAVYRWEYNTHGQKTVERHYNTRNELVEDRQGIAEYHWTYNAEGLKTEQRQYGIYGQLRADMSGVAIYAWNYDGFGNPVERFHYGIDENLVDDVSGAAMARWTYDREGQPLAMARFSRKMLPAR